MFQRNAGWVITPAHTGYISHYFNDGQTRALCGVTFTLRTVSDSNPALCNPICKRCKKSAESKGLSTTKKYF